MDRVCEGRSVIVTGAGQGLGRAHALEFARQGARLVLNDVGSAVQDVADEVRGLGGDAVTSTGDVSDWDYAAELVRIAVDAYGSLDTLVSNAGINRDRMLVTMTEQEWDLVLKVDLKGHFAPLRHAAAYWRDRSKAGEPVAARVVNTSSGAGLMGSVGQGNYAAAKAGIAVLTQIAAVELARYGVVVNAIAPSARTPMTEAVFAEAMAKPDTGFDAMDPANVSPLVAWLGSDEAAGVTGQVFEIAGGEVSLADGWRHGKPATRETRWQAGELGLVITALLDRAEPPTPVYGA
ncbi:SDR family oxidoreductase [Actinokineospora sp. NBRC 105648]|uniref:SDR family oxidoreductase n=1 Tax=Actinokineospora sp. NBRC 105648 TaxID=3032206 RepID=UPI0024A1BA28|nr:SDR family oxidoreductase [Actinokineospora sp. NBRC 105648]GLZ42004.1 putative short-chain dehydrogenase/reductase [Actinokineospora sp. NBRC 105648]